MFKVNLSLLVSFFILFFSLILVLFNSKVILGNLTPNDVFNLQSRSQPFELSPERGRFALIQSIVDYHTLFFPLEIAKYVVPDLGMNNGKFVSLFAPGVSFLLVPFYYLGKHFNASQLFTFWSVGFVAVINTFLISNIVNRITGSKTGLISGLTFLFATSAFSYATTLYQHHFTTLIILLILLLMLSGKNIIRVFLIGILFGLMLFIEYPAIIFIVPMILIYVFSNMINISKNVLHRIAMDFKIIVFTTVIFIGLIPTLLYNNYVNSNPFRLSGTVEGVNILKVDEKNNNIIINNEEKKENEKSVSGFFQYSKIPNGWNILFLSSERGIIFYSPVFLLVTFIFLVISKVTKKERFTLNILFLSSLSIILLYGMWGDPWGGWAFGPRYFIPLFALLSIILGIVLKYYGRKVWFVILYLLTFLYSVFVNIAVGLTTNAIIPTKEIESLAMPNVKYLFNIELINKGISSSFFYNRYLQDNISLQYYYLIMIFIILSMFVAAYWMFIKDEHHEN